MNALNWFEIPVTDIDRATRFYAALLGQTLKREDMEPQQMAVFPYAHPGVGGCLAKGPGCTPGPHGVIVYLNATPTLDVVLQRLPTVGGRLVTPKVQLPGDMGAFAHIEDCEGNIVGLHSVS